MLRWIRIAVAAILVVALVTSSILGFIPYLCAVGLVVAALAVGWPRLTDSPQPRTTTVMLFLFGAAGVFATWAEAGPAFLEWLPVLAGLGLLWSFVQNLVRGIGASDAVANVAAQVAGLVVVLSASSWIAAVRVPGDKSAIIIGLVSIILAQCATAPPWPARYTSPLAVLVAILGSAATSILLPASRLDIWIAMLLGLVMGLLVAAIDRMLGMIANSRFQAKTLDKERHREKAKRFAVNLAVGAAPIALGGIAVYVLERVFVQ